MTTEDEYIDVANLTLVRTAIAALGEWRGDDVEIADVRRQLVNVQRGLEVDVSKSMAVVFDD